jgi:flagellar basal body-associated protein FliL
MGNQNSEKKSVTMKKQRIKRLALVVAPLIILLAVILLLFFLKKPEPPAARDNDNNKAEDSQIVEENYQPVDFVTDEMQAKYNEIYQEKGLEETIATVYQDFEDNDTEFNWGNPYHTKYLNFQEEFNQ